MREYGLCLSGGGGKGAYEVGVYKALKQLGIDVKIKAISGSSIGAINGLFFVLSRCDDAEKLWEKMGDFQLVLGSTDMQAIRKYLINTLNNDVDYDYVRMSEISLYTTIAIQTKELKFPENVEQLKTFVDLYRECFDTRYPKVNKMSDQDIRNHVLASSALPIIYQPIGINGEKAVDGGLLDNVPIRPLIDDEDIKKLIVVMVGRDNEYDLYLASRAEEIIEIRPSKPIGDFVDGTLDFSTRSVKKRILLGYYDTLRTFDILNRKKLGIPYTEGEKAVLIEQDYNRVLTELNAAMAVKKSMDTMKQYDNLLGKYSKKYGIDL